MPAWLLFLISNMGGGRPGQRGEGRWEARAGGGRGIKGEMRRMKDTDGVGVGSSFQDCRRTRLSGLNRGPWRRLIWDLPLTS